MNPIPPSRTLAMLRECDVLIREHSKRFNEYATIDLMAKVYGEWKYPLPIRKWDIAKIEELCRELCLDLGTKPHKDEGLMYVNFTGPQATGKTTLANWLHYQMTLRGHPCALTQYTQDGEYCDLLEVRLNGSAFADLYIETHHAQFEPEPKHRGVGIVIFPGNWRLGFVRRKDTKVVFSVGPIRFCWHKVPAE